MQCTRPWKSIQQKTESRHLGRSNVLNATWCIPFMNVNFEISRLPSITYHIRIHIIGSWSARFHVTIGYGISSAFGAADSSFLLTKLSHDGGIAELWDCPIYTDTRFQSVDSLGECFRMSIAVQEMFERILIIMIGCTCCACLPFLGSCCLKLICCCRWQAVKSGSNRIFSTRADDMVRLDASASFLIMCKQGWARTWSAACNCESASWFLASQFSLRLTYKCDQQAKSQSKQTELATPVLPVLTTKSLLF